MNDVWLVVFLYALKIHLIPLTSTRMLAANHVNLMYI